MGIIANPITQLWGQMGLGLRELTTGAPRIALNLDRIFLAKEVKVPTQKVMRETKNGLKTLF